MKLAADDYATIVRGVYADVRDTSGTMCCMLYPYLRFGLIPLFLCACVHLKVCTSLLQSVMQSIAAYLGMFAAG